MNRRLGFAALVAAATALLVSASAQTSPLAPRALSGACTTAPVSIPSTTPGALFAVEITGSCLLRHLGSSRYEAIQDVFAGPAGLFLSGEGSFTAANGDRLLVRYSGPVEQTGPTTVAFNGGMTVAGGTGRFSGASGDVTYQGGAVVAPPGQPGVGWFTVAGSITY